MRELSEVLKTSARADGAFWLVGPVLGAGVTSSPWRTLILGLETGQMETEGRAWMKGSMVDMEPEGIGLGQLRLPSAGTWRIGSDWVRLAERRASLRLGFFCFTGHLPEFIVLFCFVVVFCFYLFVFTNN